MGKRVFLYLMVFSIPLALGLVAGQGVRYSALKNDLDFLSKLQEEWLEANKRLITEIASLSSSARIEQIAKDKLGLDKKKPEDVLQITIDSNR
ncbi:MAG: cell division protein FtsL [Spirochaetaceae bacterium]|nr:cell division protein FtsL [Spirochaetaceae bacterium]